jgi:type II secretory pathway pseudopilin PulG
MRSFVLLTLTVALTGCHQMPGWNPQAAPLMGQSILPNFNRTSSGLAALSQSGTQKLKGTCETRDGKLHVTVQQPAAAQQQAVCAQQMVAPMGAYGQQFRVVPGRTHRAMAMGWSAIPLPYPKIERINVPPQIQAVQQPLMARRAGIASLGMMPMGYSGMQAMNPQILQVQQNNQQQLLQQALSQLQANQSSSQSRDDCERADQLRNQTRQLENRVDQLMEMLEKRNGCNAGASAAPAPLPNTASRPHVPQIIEQTGATRSRPASRSASRVEMWPYSPQNRYRGY